MHLKIASKYFIDQGSDLIVDAAGNKIPAKSVIFCKKRAFIITKDGDINKFAGEKMDVNFFDAQVRELDAERNQIIIPIILDPLQVLGTRLEESKLPVFTQYQ